MNKIQTILLSLCVVGVVWLIYYQQVYFPDKITRCSSIAIGFEKQRHPQGDLEVTNQDISSYLKNFNSCMGD